jgi:autotransporter-associated beta strand protein
MRSKPLLGVILLILSLVSAVHVQADSATWNLNPTNGDWNTADNWTPNVVPDGPSDVGRNGSLTKIGTATLEFGGANIYSGDTTVTAGNLILNNVTGSGTGRGPVQVSGGTLGGQGRVFGAVTVGTGSQGGAILAPGAAVSKPATFTTLSAMTFKADGTYSWRLNTKTAKSDRVSANGVTIESGAQFNFVAVANRRLTPGTNFTAISNTAATPISGNFANLGDGATITVGNNSYLASYEGGDGKDLTLTVLP